MGNSYDDILYVGHPFPQTHPDRLATIGRLFGMQPAPIDGCRVLELGCGDGGNLIPMAHTLPGSEFVGIDAGARGIAIGQERAAALGLTNLRLQHLDMLDTGIELGKFDYIVSHGVYSWVPPAVQERMLEICSQNLNPHGIAYISYSAYPGGHIKQMLAEMLQYHARRFSEPRQQIEQARALLLFCSTARPDSDAFSELLRQEIDSISARHSNAIFHDELSPNLTPVYFREFAERAAKHQLQYLGEADFFEMQDSFLEQPEASAMMRSLARDQIDKEQYMDFVKCRRFRQTLLCHSGLPLNRALHSGQMRDFWIRLSARGEPPKLPSKHAIVLAAVAEMNEVYPRSLTFDALMTAVRKRAGDYEDDESILGDVVLALFACGMLRLHLHPPSFTTRPGEYPRASAVARMQLAHQPPGLENQFVTTLTHEVVLMEDHLGRLLLSLLDGSRDRAAILEQMRAGIPDAKAEDLDRALDGLAKLALLEA